MRSQKIPSVYILTPNPFPQGNVATNRFTTYAKALAYSDCRVKIFVLKGTEDPQNILNFARVGIHEGIEFEYMANSTLWDTKKSIIVKGILYLKGLLLAIWEIFKERPNCTILYTNDIVYMIAFALISRSLKINIFIDKSEYPIVLRKSGGVRSSIYRHIYIKSFELFNGIVVITRELARYYSRILKTANSIFLLPMTVDMDRFPVTEEVDVAPYFCCVFGVHNRDCILDTIIAFDSFTQLTSDKSLSLMLIGDFDNLKNGEKVREYLNASSIASRIVFTGRISSEDVIQYLIRATALITTPRAYESGGFPTKLGEYLASGRPVIATEVGEVPDFLTNLKDCLLVKPGDIEGIAKNMLFISTNPAAASEIGRRGRELAHGYFNAKKYIQKFKDFLFMSR